MCVFPKSYLFNTGDPARYPFARDSQGDWDFTRFDVEFFRHLEGASASWPSWGSKPT